MLKRLITATLTLALLLTTLAVSTPASAQRSSTAAPGAWQSAILIQNVGTGNADVTVDFYDKDGAIKESYTANALGANKSVTILVFNSSQTNADGSTNTTCCDLASGQYSAVVSSTQPVVASVQTSSIASAGAPWTAFAYEGVSAQNTGTTLYFPTNLKGYFGFNSEIVLQNAGSADTTASIEFFNAAGNKVGNTISLGPIGLNRAVTFAMTDALFTNLTAGNTGIYGAKVTSTGNVPLAGISNVWATAPTGKTASYNAFTTGSNQLFVPILTRKYYGFISALSLQNVDTVDANITVEFSNGQEKQLVLKPNAATTLLTENDTSLPEGNTNGTFGAKVTSTGGKIVGIVGYSRPANLTGGVLYGDYAYYNCPPAASAEVNVPNVLSDYFGLFTNVSVQNTGTQATDITLTYSTNQTWTIRGVDPNEVVNFLHLPENEAAGILNPLTFRSSVSAVAKSSNGQPLVAVVQHNTEPSVAGYNSGKTPSDFLHVFTATPK